MFYMAADSGTAGRRQRPLINIFTCADRKYEDFSILFALSNLHHVKGSIVEIGLEDPEAFASENRQALSLLSDEYGQDRIILRGARFRIDGRRVRSGTVRFIETPSPCEYVYISDIDIITLDPTLVDVHVAFMKRRDLPYSNSVRIPDPSRMSGLHFVRHDDWYPLPAVEDLIPRQLSDEQVLRLICERKGLHVQQEEWFRPVHGIHISPNRSPLGETRKGTRIPGWGIQPYVAAYREFSQLPMMQRLRPLFSQRITGFLDVIDRICTSQLACSATP